jgi:hypothetical protein
MKRIFTLILLSTLSYNVLAQIAGYNYSQAITVSNTSTTTAINYQLKLTINTQSLIAASQMLASGDDIRFSKTCNGATFYNYWIESGINTPTTTIWVKVDTILAGGSRTFLMAYGNATATAVSSAPLVFIPAGSATDSVASGAAGGAVNSQRGFRFSPNVDILVTSFGKREPNGTPRFVTLFDNTTQAIIAQQTVNGPAATYTYTDLPNPIWLTQGTQYIIQLYQGAADGYYFGTSSQIDSRLTYYDMRYCNSCTQNTFPTNVLSGYHYGYADFLFYYKNIITPEPTYSLSNTSLPVFSITSPTTATCAGDAIVLTANGVTSYSWNTGASTQTISVSPSVNTIYSLIGSANNCIDTRSISIIVNPLPTVTVNSGSICAGSSFTMNPTGATTYTYSNGNAVITPTANNTYTIMGTDANGCNNMTISSVTVNALPIVSVNNGTICAGKSFTMTPNGASTYTYSNGSSIDTPTANTTYTITGTDANGCVTASGVVSSVTVNPLPIVSVNSGAICAGKSFTMTPSGAITYSYSGGGAIVTPTAGATYTVTGTDVNGCNNTTVSSVTVNAAPVISVNSGSICSGNSFTIIPSGATTYSYSSGGAVVSPTTSTNYTVTGTNTMNCSSTAISSVSVSTCVGIEEFTNNNSINIFPNPTSLLLNIELLIVNDGNYKVDVSNALGQVVLTETVISKNVVINTQHLITGMYFVNIIKNNNVIATKKIIKE